jgi:NTE family protein
MRDLMHLDRRVLVDTVRSLFGRPAPYRDGSRRGGILDPRGIEALVARACPFSRIGENIRAGRIRALTLSTTHVGSGRTVVFVQRAEPGLPRWSADPTVEARAVTIRPEHALASAAIPFLFPAVRIDGEFYCDGGLRQNVPLSPARRLGADGLIVVSPRVVERASIPLEQQARETEFPGPLFLLGKAMNALLLDRIENDIDRLERINRILVAGCRHYGDGFLDALNHELGNSGTSLRTRPLRVVLIRSSMDIGRLASDFVRGSDFAKRVPGLLGRFIRRVAESTLEADLLSYLLFDGEFAARLMALGRADARKQHNELCSFFDELAPDRSRIAAE